MRADITIEIVVIAEKMTGQSRVVYISDCARADEAMDMFVSDPGKLIALYHQSAYRDDTLRARRHQNAMVYPGMPNEKMILVGQVRGKLTIDHDSHIEISRAQLHLTDIPIDEV
ncbi:MAG: hypothetical protein ACXU7D_09185 [Burkholderiaceae bacterium]